MRSTWLVGLGLVAASVAAEAQTYDLDITVTGVAATPVSFSGSFSFNANGTGFCSAAFCAPGLTPDFADVLISNPLSIDPPGAPFAFTGASGDSSTLVFFDIFGGTPGQSSLVDLLAFNIDRPLGGTSSSIGLSNIYFTTDGNHSGTYSCGGPTRLPTIGVSCTAASLVMDRDAGAGGSGGVDPPRGVPEPGTLSLLALGLVSIAIARPRRSSGLRARVICAG